MSTYKLTYFNGRGRGELSRWIFAAANQTYDDIRVEFADWPKLKGKTPFGHLPILEVDGVTLTQSTTISRYLARRLDLAGIGELEQAQVDMVADYANDMFADFCNTLFGNEEVKAAYKKLWDDSKKDEFLGTLEKYLSSNDKKSGYFIGQGLTVADMAVVTALEMIGDVDWARYPELQVHKTKVESNPGIAKWLSIRKTTPW